MSILTKETIIKINEKCKNGWRLNVRYFIYHNEKTLIKQIPLNETNYLEFTLKYNSQNQITLYISKFYHEKGSDFASSSGLGKVHILAEWKYKRKILEKLIRVTPTLDDKKLLEINSLTNETTGYEDIIQQLKKNEND